MNLEKYTPLVFTAVVAIFNVGKGEIKWEEGTYDEIIFVSAIIHSKNGEWADEVEVMNIKKNVKELQGYLIQTDPRKIKHKKENKPAEKWYRAIKTTSEFVSNNPEIHIINKEDYEQKIKQFVEKGVERKIFEVINEKFIEKRLNAKIRRIIKENTKALKARQANLAELKDLIKIKSNMNNTKKGERTTLENINSRINKLKDDISATINLKKVMHKATEKSRLGMPRMYGTVKIHKQGRPIRPIVDTRNSVGGPIAEMLSTILKTYKCKTVNILNTEDLIDRLKKIKLEQEETIDEEEEEENILASLDVTDMFTNIPVKTTI